MEYMKKLCHTRLELLNKLVYLVNPHLVIPDYNFLTIHCLEIVNVGSSKYKGTNQEKESKDFCIKIINNLHLLFYIMITFYTFILDSTLRFSSKTSLQENLIWNDIFLFINLLLTNKE